MSSSIVVTSIAVCSPPFSLQYEMKFVSSLHWNEVNSSLPFPYLSLRALIYTGVSRELMSQVIRYGISHFLLRACLLLLQSISFFRLWAYTYMSLNLYWSGSSLNAHWSWFLLRRNEDAVWYLLWGVRVWCLSWTRALSGVMIVSSGNVNAVGLILVVWTK